MWPPPRYALGLYSQIKFLITRSHLVALPPKFDQLCHYSLLCMRRILVHSKSCEQSMQDCIACCITYSLTSMCRKKDSVMTFELWSILFPYSYTLQVVLSSDMRIFLAARSRCTNNFPERYSMPKATCRVKLSKVGLISGGTSFVELSWYNKVKIKFYNHGPLIINTINCRTVVTGLVVIGSGV